ncbi:MAG: hypothetical protein ABFD50_22575 [Smithella sp.]
MLIDIAEDHLISNAGKPAENLMHKHIKIIMDWLAPEKIIPKKQNCFRRTEDFFKLLEK